ncbi:hypothetical protein DWU98_12605 [Dyella monticola]|uniref:Quinol:cytochrome C oxidoreductase n=1 Tax=Dyella monticola TaxID=1927958 RepID=A0A370WXF1_9GAMM|nr:hypothetical protein [Dyella monticola]RDS80792.1 hypothetical protein DWU98_12605 [Dyella monticola]
MTRSAAFSIGASVAALVLLVLGFCFAVGHLRHALLVYLASWLFLLGMVLGSMFLRMIHVLTGGEWGVRLGLAWTAATRLFPYAAIGVVPLLIGMHAVLPWLDPHAVVDDPYLDAQRWYLNAPGLIIRTVVLFVVWACLAYVLTRRPASDGEAVRPGFAAGGLVAMLLTVTVTAVDWVMSLVPHWHSTDIALLLFTSQLLVAFTLSVVVYLVRDAVATATPAQVLRDFGNLMLVMVLGWAYVSFIDYLTSWVADLPAETAWYVPRLLTGWWWFGVAVACLGLGIPFFLLLMGKVKSSRYALCAVAAISLVAQWINLIWLVLPSGAMHGVALRWTDPLIVIGLLGFCATRYVTWLQRWPGGE